MSKKFWFKVSLLVYLTSKQVYYWVININIWILCIYEAFKGVGGGGMLLLCWSFLRPPVPGRLAKNVAVTFYLRWKCCSRFSISFGDTQFSRPTHLREKPRGRGCLEPMAGIAYWIFILLFTFCLWGTVLQKIPE